MSAPVLDSERQQASGELSNPAIVACYRTHQDAEDAVRLLVNGGIPTIAISIMGRNFETSEQVLGFYRPSDAAADGATQGAWYGGLFGLMLGAVGFFAIPAVGAFFVLGPISGMVAGMIGGAGLGALINALIAAGVPQDKAIKYQERLQAGEFLILVKSLSDVTSRAHDILLGTPQIDLQGHTS